MKKKVPVKQILSIAVSVLLVVGIIVLMASAADGSKLEQQTGEIVTPIDFVRKPIASDGTDQLIAQRGSLRLWANLESACIRLEDIESGKVWNSKPADIDENKSVKGAAKFSVSSLIQIRYANRDANSTLQNVLVGSVNKKNFNAFTIPDGVRFEFYFKKEGFLIPLEIRLTDKGMTASVPVTEIKEESNQMLLTSVIVLPGFGAQKAKTEGYLLIPDGSGTLMDFSMREAGYSGRVFGKDAAIVSKTKTETDPSVFLPVFGIQSASDALVGIITKGAARANILAAAPGAKSPYATVSSEFIYRESILADVSQKTFEFTQVNMFEQTPSQIDTYQVEYRTCAESGYVGMAQTYRAYLMDECGMKPMTEKNDGLYIEYVGGVRKQVSVLGIPMQKVVPVTAFREAGQLSDRLKSEGVDRIITQYSDWAKGTSDSRLTVDMKPDGALGGTAELKSLLEQQKKQGNPLYLDCNLNEMVNDQWGYSTRYNAAQSVQQEPAIQYTYKMSTFQIDVTAKLKYLLSPTLMTKAADQTARSAEKWQLDGISLNSMGQLIYSDFGRGRAMDRGKVEEVYDGILRSLKEKQSNLLFSAPNAYVFPYASCMTDLPVSSDGWRECTESVPFYAAALHGLVPLASQAVNSAPDAQQALLKSLENGLQLKYTLGAAHAEELNGTFLEPMSYISADLWLKKAAEQYRQTKVYLNGVSDQKLVSHTKLAENVYKTVFENGMGVIVNYSSSAYPSAEGTVPANGYLPLNW